LPGAFAPNLRDCDGKHGGQSGKRHQDYRQSDFDKFYAVTSTEYAIQHGRSSDLIEDIGIALADS
jgi:hypothetical protein